MKNILLKYFDKTIERLTDTVDFPTPPFPEPIAIILLIIIVDIKS